MSRATSRAVPERKHISPSEIKDFLSCPARWWFRYRLGLWTDSTTTFFAAGNGVHAGLERWYFPVDPHNADAALGSLRKKLRAETAKIDWPSEPEQTPLTLRAKAEGLFAASVKEPDDWEAESIEKVFMVDIIHSTLGKLPYQLKVKPDMRLVTGAFVEHKTANASWPKGKEHSEVQPVAYKMVGQQHFEQDPTTIFNIMVDNKLPLVDRRTVKKTQDDIDRLYLQVRTMLDAEEAGIVYPNPTSWAHHNCEYRKPCDAWQGGLPLVPDGRALQVLVPGLSNRVAHVSDEPLEPEWVTADRFERAPIGGR